jgi:hypothetical protein
MEKSIPNLKRRVLFIITQTALFSIDFIIQQLL